MNNDGEISTIVVSQGVLSRRTKGVSTIRKLGAHWCISHAVEGLVEVAVFRKLAGVVWVCLLYRRIGRSTGCGRCEILVVLGIMRNNDANYNSDNDNSY